MLRHHQNLLDMGQAPNLTDVHLNHSGSIFNRGMDRRESRDDQNALNKKI